jgi:hypothetical protein
MAKNMIRKYSEEGPRAPRVRTLAATTLAGAPLLDPLDARPAVALSNSGDATATITSAVIPMGGGVSALTYANGGVGLTGKQTLLAYDGTYEFAGVVSTGSTPIPVSTADRVQVFITSAGALTLVPTGNTAYGRIDYPIDYLRRAGIVPVQIGL